MNIVDRLIDTRGGRIFARSWRPAREAQDGSLFLLFHIALGCADLWRNFPERRALALNRPVVAYDRLGFGRSDPCPGRLPLDFMQAEARDSAPALCAALGLERLIPSAAASGARWPWRPLLVIEALTPRWSRSWPRPSWWRT